jgi:uncharacterized membrane protein YgcG
MKLFVKLLIASFVLFVYTPISASSADVNDFSFESFDATYEISVNEAEDKRPEMIVTEKLVAVFPMVEQNRGIRRSIPLKSYQLFPGQIEIVSVTDESGKPREFEQTTDAEFLNLAIKSSDNSYVFGKQTYVIKYKQNWVFSNFESGEGSNKVSEFYWDINGNGWPQNFGRVSATVILDPVLAANVVPKSMRCYEGNFGSTGSCKVTQPSENTYVFSSDNLQAKETQTVAIGFKAGVANVDGPKAVESSGFLGFILALIVLVGLMVWAVYYRVTKLKDQDEAAFIVPQYQPPKEPDLVIEAVVARKQGHLHQASVIELAIKKLIEIEEVANSKKSAFILRRTSLQTTNKNQLAILNTLGLSKPGAEINLSADMNAKEQAKLSTDLLKLKATFVKQANSSGYFRKRALGIPALVFVGVMTAIVALFFFAARVDSESVSFFTLIPFFFTFPYVTAYWVILSKKALTTKGSVVEDHVKGMAAYIKLAEQDRLAFLQSPQGGSLKPSEVEGKTVLKLYEEILPWAILLGLHKQWNGVLNNLYEKNETPTWFVGAPVFSQSFSNLDQVLNQSLSVDSSGGSGGGGSAGGGSGGGGGGGI